jgi:uncharacterized protein YegL
MSDDFETFGLQTSSYNFSAIGTDDLEADAYTLVTIAVDNSGSIAGLSDAINQCMGEVIKACRNSPRADNLMVRVVSFGSRVEEHHGFKLLMNCAPDDYAHFISGGGGMTALNDAAVNAIEAANVYAQKLKDDDYEVNGLVVVISDGCENQSTNTTQQVSDVLKQVQMNEQIDGGLLSILIGVEQGYGNTLAELKDWQQKTGFAQYVPIADAKDKHFAKVANFISRSVSSQSQAVNGGASQPVPFDQQGSSSLSI